MYVQACQGGPASLRPYRDADPARLLITGSGSWDISDLLGPELLVPFLDPIALRSIPASDQSFHDTTHNDPRDALALFKLWDCKGLLRIVPAPRPANELVHVFGCFKNDQRDRMIGDRRGPNSLEGKVKGPSGLLPPGFLLCGLSVPRFTHALVGVSTDRSDFYHQIQITPARTASNAVGPALMLSDFLGTKAHAEYLRAAAVARHLPREEKGDDFGVVPRSLLVGDEACYGAFASLFQGDHGGVEYATAAHEALLANQGMNLRTTRTTLLRMRTHSRCRTKTWMMRRWSRPSLVASRRGDLATGIVKMMEVIVLLFRRNANGSSSRLVGGDWGVSSLAGTKADLRN